MNVQKILCLVLLACILASVFGTVYAVDYVTHLEISATNIYLTAGRQNSLTINIDNSGVFDITEFEAQLSSNTPGLAVIFNNHKVINEIGSEESISYNATLYVDQNLQQGSYALSYAYSYVRNGDPLQKSIPIYVIVSTAFTPSVKFDLPYAKIEANKINTISFNIQNIADDELTNIQIILSSNSPHIVLNNETVFKIQKLNASSSSKLITEIKTLENAQIGVYSLTASISYQDKTGNSFRQTANISLEITSVSILKSPIFTVRNLNTKNVIPGEIFDLILNIECNDASANNVKATLTLDSKGLLSPLSPTTSSLGDMDANKNAELKYSLLLDGSVQPGQMPIILSLNYLDSRGIHGSTLEIITIQVEPIVGFKLLNSEISAERGKIVSFESDLLLIGTSRLEFAGIELLSSGPIQAISGSSEYLGAIDPDSPVPFTLKADIGLDAQPRDYTVQFKVTYSDYRYIQREKIVEAHITIIEPVTINVDNGGFWAWLRQILGL